MYFTCTAVLEQEGKRSGTVSHAVKIDKTYLFGRIKYGTGRLLSGEKALSAQGDEISGWNEDVYEAGNIVDDNT